MKAISISEKKFNTKILLIHISTDAVYESIHGNYREIDKCRPQNIYGKSKLMGEKYVKKLKNYIYGNKRYHCVLCCVGHKEYRDMDVKSVTNLLMENGLIADVKGIWRQLKTSKVYRRWTL